jgi:hypothetical protein
MPGKRENLGGVVGGLNSRLVLQALLALVGAFCINAASIDTASADPKRDNCTKEARAAEARYMSKSQEERDSARGAGIAVSTLLFGVVGLVMSASTTDDQIRRDIYTLRERSCLREAGLDPLSQSTRAVMATPKGGKADGRARTVSSGSSASGSKCACKEMTTCTGSWVSMSCNQLKDLCRGAATKPIVWTRNGCEKLQTLVGGF